MNVEIDFTEAIKRLLVVWQFNFIGGLVSIWDGLLIVVTLGLYGGEWSRDYWTYVDAYYRLHYPDIYQAVKDTIQEKEKMR